MRVRDDEKLANTRPATLPAVHEKEGEGEPGESFLHRWSQRKHEARQPASVAPAAAAEPATPAKPLTDADMPALASLGADSDFTPFMSPGVSEKLRRKALHKLFRLPQFSQRDPLDGEYYDCHGYLPLGDTITYDMREEMERAAQKLKEADAMLARSKAAAPAPEHTRESAGRSESAEPRATARHSSHLRKRNKRKRSKA